MGFRILPTSKKKGNTADAELLDSNEQIAPVPVVERVEPGNAE